MHLRSHSTSQKKFLLTSQTACLHLCAVTGLSIDWPNFFSTEWSNLHVELSVVTGVSIDNSKKFFLATRGLVVCVLGVMSLVGEQTGLLLELALVSNF